MHLRPSREAFRVLEMLYYHCGRISDLGEFREAYVQRFSELEWLDWSVHPTSTYYEDACVLVRKIDSIAKSWGITPKWGPRITAALL